MPRIGPSSDDRFAIADLCATYAWALDTGDTETLVACFTEDAVFDEIVLATGHVEIRDSVEALFHKNPLFAGRQHLIGQSLFEPDREGRADRWHMRSFAHVVVQRDTGTSLFWTGWYDDIVTRLDGEWLFAFRKPSPWTGPVLDGFPDGTVAKVQLPSILQRRR